MLYFVFASYITLIFQNFCKKKAVGKANRLVIAVIAKWRAIICK